MRKEYVFCDYCHHQYEDDENMFILTNKDRNNVKLIYKSNQLTKGNEAHYCDIKCFVKHIVQLLGDVVENDILELIDSLKIAYASKERTKF